jgi:hypothetical protein
MAHGRARDERKERQWQRWIGEWQASGLSGRAFCQRRGLAVASFYAWASRGSAADGRNVPQISRAVQHTPGCRAAGC